MVTLYNNQNSIPRERQEIYAEKDLQKRSLQEAKAWKAAQDLEATFASQMVQELIVEKENGLFGGGQTETMFRSVWAEQIGKCLVGTFGLAESVYPVMLRKMENMLSKEAQKNQEE